MIGFAFFLLLDGAITANCFDEAVWGAAISCNVVAIVTLFV